MFLNFLLWLLTPPFIISMPMLSQGFLADAQCRSFLTCRNIASQPGEVNVDLSWLLLFFNPTDVCLFV
jgi:hypothetical protein